MSLAVLFAVGALAAPSQIVTFTIDARPVVIDAAVGVAPCQDGRTRVAIRSPGGSSSLCHLFTSKTTTSGFDPKTIVDRVIETDALPGGTIISRATYTFRFARDGLRATVSIRGVVLRGTGRYAGARGAVSGGGTQTNGRQRLTIAIRSR